MVKKCDFYTERCGRYWCIIKDSEISTATYKEYCYYDNIKKCPIYQYYEKEKKR